MAVSAPYQESDKVPFVIVNFARNHSGVFNARVTRLKPFGVHLVAPYLARAKRTGRIYFFVFANRKSGRVCTTGANSAYLFNFSVT